MGGNSDFKNATFFGDYAFQSNDADFTGANFEETAIQPEIPALGT